MKHYVAPSLTNPTLPNLSDYLKDSIASFCYISQMPVTFYSTEGNILWECCSEFKLCNFSNLYSTPGSVCRRNLISSANFAAKLGEPYISICHIGLIQIAVSLIIEGKPLGCFIAGPLIMGTLRERTLSSLLQNNEIGEDQSPKLMLFLRQMKSYDPKEINHLALLLNNCVLASIDTHFDYTQKKQQHKEQIRIGEELQTYKKQNVSMEYPFDMENKLIQKTKNGDTEGATEILRELLNRIAILESGDLNAIRTKFLGIYAVLSRNIAEQDADFHETMELDYQDMHELNHVKNFNELVNVAITFIHFCCRKAIQNIYDGNSPVIIKSVKYVNHNFTKKITLQGIAEDLHVNPSYLSMLFKQELNMTFSEYLSKIRVNKAKHLLIKTNLSMVDISFQSGFEDQSYFTKVFKKLEKCTPKEYRKVHQNQKL